MTRKKQLKAIIFTKSSTTLQYISLDTVLFFE